LMGEALSWMQSNTPAGSTLAVLPAGVMLNYMLRRANPTPYLRWNPPEMAVFGQANMTRALRQARPDYILLLGVDTSEFGVNFFGQRQLRRRTHALDQPILSSHRPARPRLDQRRQIRNQNPQTFRPQRRARSLEIVYVFLP